MRKLMKVRALLACSLVVAVAIGAGQSFDPGAYLEHVKYLASEKLEGRATGSRGLDLAAEYIARVFQQAGLGPGAGRSYYQEFPVSVDVALGEGNRLQYCIGQDCTTLELGKQFVPLNFSGSGRCRGPVVFAGYGISAPELGYDDFAGVDLKGKIVIVFRHEPQEFDDSSIFAGRIQTEYSQPYSKALEMLQRGACAGLMVNDVSNHGGHDGSLEEFNGAAAPADVGIPFIHVDAAVVRRWFAHAGRDLEKIGQTIDRELKPVVFELPNELQVDVQAELMRTERVARNVIGFKPGRSTEYVIIGAHYDHLGRGEQFSMAPERAGEIHPGADDNASGTAALLELARYFGRRPPLRRGLLFIAFAGEELGLLGSGYWVRHPLLRPEDAVAMINLDMVGRIRDGRVYVGGLSTSPDWKPLVEELAQVTSLKLDFTEDSAYGSSDHTAFSRLRVPVLYFFSGLHADYHKPSDTWDKIEAEPAAQLLSLVARLVERLAESPTRLSFVVGQTAQTR